VPWAAAALRLHPSPFPPPGHLLPHCWGTWPSEAFPHGRLGSQLRTICTKGLRHVRKRFNRSATFTWIACMLFTGANLPRLVRHCGASASKVWIDHGPHSLRRHLCWTERGHVGGFGAFLWLKRRRESLRHWRDDACGGPSLVRGARHT
jgi:hypothetical protein